MLKTFLKSGLVLAALVILVAPAEAWDFGSKKPKTKHEVDPLIWAVSHNPSLLHVDYLSLALGPPVKAIGGESPHYIWYDSDRKPTHELIQKPTRDAGVETTMLFHLKGDSIEFDELHKLYGTQSRRFFDYTGQPNELYTFAPNTFLAFVSPPNSFGASEAKVVYRGPAVPAPSAEDLAAAEARLYNRAHTASSADADFSSKRKPGKSLAGGVESPLAYRHELLPLLAERARRNPMDPMSHLMLAEAFKRDARLHEAIGEFKIALALSGNNSEVREACLRRLDEMMILPTPVIPLRRNLEIVNGGQHMRVVGLEEQSKNANSK